MSVGAVARVAALVAVAVVGAAACSSTTPGHGVELTRSGPTSHDFPTTSPPASTSASSTPASTTATASPSPTVVQLAAQLAQLTPGRHNVLVAVPGGYEAISYDQTSQIGFWKYAGTDWQQVGTSSYPYSSAIGAPADAKAVGALLTGMRDATFIVTGNFTGDGSGNAVAYTTGARGWGAIKAERNGNIGPSGQPVGADRIGLSFGFAFVGGRLQTKDCPLNQPIAACGANPVVKLWQWTGADFVRV